MIVNTHQDLREQAARLALEVERSGVRGYHAKINFVFMFAACLLGAYGSEELRRLLLGDKPNCGREGVLNEFARHVDGAGPDGGDKPLSERRG